MLLLLFGLTAAVFRVEMASADDVVVEVTADQRVSLSGRSESRKSVVEDVCYRAGVEVLFYDATDRPFGGSYRELPLGVLLGRVLSEESFMTETVGDPAGGIERVTTLRVLGDPAVASARRSRSGPGRTQRFQVPPALVETAFEEGSASPAEREAALATLAARIAGDPRELDGFLTTESRLIADAIRRHAGAEGALRELQRRYPDPRISRKIDEIIAALAEPVSAR